VQHSSWHDVVTVQSHSSYLIALLESMPWYLQILFSQMSSTLRTYTLLPSNMVSMRVRTYTQILIRTHNSSFSWKETLSKMIMLPFCRPMHLLQLPSHQSIARILSCRDRIALGPLAMMASRLIKQQLIHLFIEITWKERKIGKYPFARKLKFRLQVQRSK